MALPCPAFWIDWLQGAGVEKIRHDGQKSPADFPHLKEQGFKIQAFRSQKSNQRRSAKAVYTGGKSAVETASAGYADLG